MRFTGALIEGHKGVRVVLVPFDPTSEWGEPVRLAGRRHGWPVRGTANGVAFAGYVGERWGRFFIILDGFEVGESIDLVVKPSAQALAHAIDQSKLTTQPKVARVIGTPSRRVARRT